MNKTESQNRRLLKHLLKSYMISSMTAFNLFGITSLHRRLADLRSGYNGFEYPIKGEWVKHDGVRYKVYSMSFELLNLKLKKLKQDEAKRVALTA